MYQQQQQQRQRRTLLKKRQQMRPERSLLWPLLAGALLVAAVVALIWYTDDDDDDSVPSYVLPELRPSVESTAPEAFQPARRRALVSDMSFEAQIASRFFSGEGPTDVYSLLDSVDNRISELNLRSPGRSCMNLEPVQVELPRWPGENLTIFAHCYEEIDEDGFLMFGVRNGTAQLYSRIGATTLVAYARIAEGLFNESTACCYRVNGDLGEDCACVDGSCMTPSCRTTPEGWPESTARSYRNVSSALVDVDIYFSVGVEMNASETGSRGLMHLVARPSENTFQASVAGIGLGFCGAQFASDGASIRFVGSQDGVNGACQPKNETCVLAQDLGAPGDCAAVGFSLAPLGRAATEDFLFQSVELWAASQYPDFGDFAAVDVGAGGNSSVAFGPAAVPLGEQYAFY